MLAKKASIFMIGGIRGKGFFFTLEKMYMFSLISGSAGTLCVPSCEGLAHRMLSSF